MISRTTTRSFFLAPTDPQIILPCGNRGERFLIRRIGEILTQGVNTAEYRAQLWGPLLTKDGTPHAVRTHCMGWTNGLVGTFPGQIPFPMELRHILIGPDALKGELLATY